MEGLDLLRDVRYGPATIVRRCRLPVGAIREFGDSPSWELAGEVAEATDRTRAAGRQLADRIADLVPAVPPQVRGGLLRLRRDAFNGRPPRRSDVERAVGAEPETAAYLAAREHRETAVARLADRMRQHADLTAATLTLLLANGDFAASVDLSVPELLPALTRPGGERTGLDGPLDSRRRRWAVTLLRMALRAATKPTPLHRFTESTLVVDGGQERPASGRISFESDLLARLGGWAVAGHPAPADPDHVWLTTNPTLSLTPAADGTRMRWVRIDASGAEQLVSARCPPEIAPLVVALRTPATVRQVVASVAGPGATAGRLPRALDALVGRGVLELGLLRVGTDVLDHTRAALAPETEVAAALHDLAALRRAWSDRPGGRRAALVRRATDLTARLSAALRMPAAPPVVIESLEGVRAPSDDDPPVDAEALRDLAALQGLLPLLGGEVPIQIADAACFRQRFGTDPVPLFEAYQWHVRSGRAEASALLRRCDEPLLARVLALRTRMIDELRRLALTHAGQYEVSWSREAVEQLVDALPRAVPRWTCVSWVLQSAAGRHVVNGASSGYGRLAARMGSVIRDHELSTLRRWIDGADTDPEDALVVDIAAGLGASVNERPRLLTTALGYPGSALECDPQARIDPGGCVVRATPQGRLVLESDRWPGRPLLPVPHNGTMPQLGPPLYRWLARFGPPLGATCQFWNLVDGPTTQGGRPAVRSYPRLRLGSLVLSRRTWKVDIARLPTLPRSGTGSAEELVAWRRWCDETGVPRRSFVHPRTVPDTWDVVRGLAPFEEITQARSRAGDAARKPMYVDLSQPLSWPLVTQQSATVTFTEPLPDPDALPADAHIAEYIVETSRPIRHSTTGGQDVVVVPDRAAADHL
ncbi:lantibiotic dehydratase [Micromonospora sp. ATCC 39149]|uniref:Lantibiotic dehydratase N-terminal domain-containing protein n=1 Tax=Micromonospora carbonacea TaxID=47853 RepID=A0A7D6C859_9ACTN|nr:lantibiotic dehydratase [Micromonospora sp. ATCC 39149]QLJ99527.1 hypothetical protein HZU44_05230 [Micromonospora carbonacea]